MTRAYVVEYAGFASTNSEESRSSTPLSEPLATYVIDYTAGAAVGPPINVLTRIVDISVDSVCSVAYSPTGTANATVNNLRLPAGIITRGVRQNAAGTAALSFITNT